MKGEVARFDLTDKRSARSLSRRTSASPRAMCASWSSRAPSTFISVPEDFLVGRIAGSSNMVDGDTGEIIAKANEELTDVPAEEAALGGPEGPAVPVHQ